MDKFIITGGKKLEGKIQVSGAKNAVLPMMAAALLTTGKTILHNVPQINDIKMMAHLLRIIGARVTHENDVMIIDAKDCNYWEAPYELVSKMRASIYVLGPLLARFGRANVSFPGGCAIGNRPVDLHLKAMEALGTHVDIKAGYINAEAKKLTGGEIFFSKSSVGATANLLMAAVMAEGDTYIYNAALEPEISYMIDCLNAMGAQIEGKDSTNLKIRGVDALKAIEVEVIPDRIEAGTFAVAAAITGGNIRIERCVPEHIISLLGKLKDAGLKVERGNDYVQVSSTGMIKSVEIITNPYPAFPTDLQAQFMSLMTLADGSSYIEENIFPDRFMHVAELNRLDADIHLENNVAIVRGVKKLSGAEVMATDLRASAALVLAGLAAEGTTIISRIYHIDRGYYQIEKKLQQVGADIKRSIG